MERIKPPSELDIDSLNLPDVWKEWKEAWELYRISSGLIELRSFRLRVVSPTVCSPTVRVDSPTSHMSVCLRVKTCVTTVDSSTLCAIALGS